MSNEISIIQNYSFYSEEDNIVTIEWVVENNSEKSIKDVKAVSQAQTNDFGEIDSGNSKSFRFNFKIPSAEDVKKDFGEDATVADPYIIGPVTLDFTIENESYSIKSNSLEI